jgi:hypothetical protein
MPASPAAAHLKLRPEVERGDELMIMAASAMGDSQWLVVSVSTGFAIEDHANDASLSRRARSSFYFGSF